MTPAAASCSMLPSLCSTAAGTHIYHIRHDMPTCLWPPLLEWLGIYDMRVQMYCLTKLIMSTNVFNLFQYY